MNWKLDAEWSLRDLNPTGAPGFYPSLQLQKEALQSMKTSLKYSMSDLEMYQFSLIGIRHDSPAFGESTEKNVGK